MGKTLQIDQTIANLQAKGFEALYAKSKDDVLELLDGILEEGLTVAAGGSETLKEVGLFDLIAEKKLNYLDRREPDLSREQLFEVIRNSFTADLYFSSANALTVNGEIYNVDGWGNRVAAIDYGPSKVILIVGKNKLVPDLKAAVERVRFIAAPKNAKKLKRKTYCAEHGHCIAAGSSEMTAGCDSPDRICKKYQVVAGQPAEPALIEGGNRIKIIIVGEELGF